MKRSEFELSEVFCVLKFKVWFLQSVFAPITVVVFCFILQNALCKILLFAEYPYLLRNCCLGYCVMQWFATAQ